MTNLWERFWFRPASRRGIDVARILVSANALWILLSRPDLPAVVSWPAPFWSAAGAMRLRYGYFLSEGAERALYWLACLALVAALAGIATRAAALTAGLLLVHLAPLENVIASRIGPFFNGLTLPALALLIIAFASPTAERSRENRWPFALIQVLLAFTYLLAGASKIRYSGFGWATSSNMRGTITVFNAFEPAHRPVARWLLAHPAICGAIVVATILMELAFFVVLVSRIAARIAVPLLLTGHLGIYLVLGVVFLDFPLVLLFLDWDG